MGDITEHPSVEISRRTWMRGVAVAGAWPLLALGVKPASAYSQEQAGYQDHPYGDQKCSKCTHFIKPHSCLTVYGFISPNGWCKGWTTIPPL
jgi:hypothetical protein